MCSVNRPKPFIKFIGKYYCVNFNKQLGEDLERGWGGQIRMEISNKYFSFYLDGINYNWICLVIQEYLILVKLSKITIWNQKQSLWAFSK